MILKKIGKITLILVVIVSLGLAGVSIHPQLIVGAIQKMIYKNEPVNRYTPIHTPTKGLTSLGQYKITDLCYDHDLPNSFLDITYPSKKMASYPILFYFHGGGFFAGSKDMGDPLATNAATALLDDLCEKGYVIVNVDYALVPQARFPTPLIQANQAFRWISKYARKYHLDMQRIIIMGSSAGAIMASQLGAVMTNNSYAKELGIHPSLTRSQIRAVVVDDAPLDYDHFPFACKLLIGNYVKGNIFLSKVEKEHYNSILHINKDYPPTFLLGSEYRRDMIEMHRALDHYSVINELVDPLAERGKAMPHCFVAMERTSMIAADAFKRLTVFLKKALL